MIRRFDGLEHINPYQNYSQQMNKAKEIQLTVAEPECIEVTGA